MREPTDNKRRAILIDDALSSPAALKNLMSDPSKLEQVLGGSAARGIFGRPESSGNRAEYRGWGKKRTKVSVTERDELRAKRKRERQNKKKGRR